MPSPDCGNGVKQGQLRIRRGRDVVDGKVTDQERIDQRRHANGQQDKDEREGDPSDAHPVHIASLDRDKRRDNPKHREHEGNDNGKMSDFDDHG